MSFAKPEVQDAKVLETDVEAALNPVKAGVLP
jgi:hypothetical protein